VSVCLSVCPYSTHMLLTVVEKFQENLLKTVLQIEEVFFDLAKDTAKSRSCLVICDRGAMDPSACQ
jgi:hypothetical protein